MKKISEPYGEEKSFFSCRFFTLGNYDGFLVLWILVARELRIYASIVANVEASRFNITIFEYLILTCEQNLYPA